MSAPEQMYDGSEMLPTGTYVQVEEVLPETAHRVARSYIGRIVGTDMGRSKYQIGSRYGGWGEWLFLDGGSWAFPGHVTEISEAQALAAPETVEA
jgi:hypothetical protein